MEHTDGIDMDWLAGGMVWYERRQDELATMGGAVQVAVQVQVTVQAPSASFCGEMIKV